VLRLVVEEIVSVVIAIDSRRERLNSAIESVLSQTYANWELLIVDDQSAFRQDLSDRHANIKLVKKPVSNSIAASLNAAVTLAKGQYIAFLDPDDSWPATKLAEQLEACRSCRDVALCYTNFVESGATAVFTDKRSDRFEKAFITEPLKLNQGSGRVYRAREEDRDLASLVFAEEQQIPLSTVMIDRKCLPYTGLFDPMLMHAPACDMWIKILRRFDAIRTDSQVLCYSRPLDSQSRSGSAFDHAEIYAKYVQYGMAWENPKLIELATTLGANASIHIDRCHRFA
jgi:glycosyltransferase involved in cell wall biosynthesis